MTCLADVDPTKQGMVEAAETIGTDGCVIRVHFRCEMSLST